MDANDIRDALGSTDIMLLDQFMRGRIAPGMRVLDGGCGSGRNTRFFVGAGLDVWAIDRDARAVDRTRANFRAVAPEYPVDARVRVAELDDLPFDDAAFDVVLAIAVLHFARDDAHFTAIVRECWRVLATGGMFFARLVTDIALDATLAPTSGHDADTRWFRLPDGSDRYVASEAQFRALTADLGAEWLDPLKSVNVDNQRCMTTWVLRKPV